MSSTMTIYHNHPLHPHYKLKEQNNSCLETFLDDDIPTFQTNLLTKKFLLKKSISFWGWLLL